MKRNEITAILLELLEDETGETRPDLTDEMNLRDELKLDSVDMVSLVLRIETRFDIEIGSSELEQVTRVGDLLDLLQAKLSGGADRKAA